jgi:L-threonylcarbamoyladenylate synthase
VLTDLDGRIDAVLDAGPTMHGVESTVLDPCRSPMLIYRPGAVSAEEIQEIVGPVEIFRESAELTEMTQESLPSPGIGMRHYAPRARLILVEGPLEILGKLLEKAALELHSERVGIMLPFGVDAPLGLAGRSVFFWGRWTRPAEMARELYAGLRTLDQEGCTVILCPLPPSDGIGAAIRDRLLKAAVPLI